MSLVTIEIEEKETKHRNVFYIIVGILIIVLPGNIRQINSVVQFLLISHGHKNLASDTGIWLIILLIKQIYGFKE